MTTKERLERFVKIYKNYTHVEWLNLNSNDLIDILEDAIKDLEVLEILKRLIDIDYKVNFYTNRIDAIPKKILINGTLTKQELEKIQEWLEK